LTALKDDRPCEKQRNAALRALEAAPGRKLLPWLYGARRIVDRSHPFDGEWARNEGDKQGFRAMPR